VSARKKDHDHYNNSRPLSELAAFNRTQAAQYLSISTRSLDYEVKKGTIARVKYGTKNLFTRTECDRWLKQLEKQG